MERRELVSGQPLEMAAHGGEIWERDLETSAGHRKAMEQRLSTSGQNLRNAEQHLAVLEPWGATSAQDLETMEQHLQVLER